MSDFTAELKAIELALYEIKSAVFDLAKIVDRASPYDADMKYVEVALQKAHEQIEHLSERRLSRLPT